MYSIASYGSMVADTIRMRAYIEALEQAIKPNDVVLDLGAGTGIFSIIACQLGARKVYAIDPNDAILVAKNIAAANGCADRIEFIHDLSTKINLPEQVNVIISDLRGVLPLFGAHIPSLTDARKRFLAPDGILMPQQDRLWVTLVEAAEVYQEQYRIWTDNPYDIDMHAALDFSINTWWKKSLSAEQLLLPPAMWGIVDYSVTENPNVAGTVQWIVERAGIAHGLQLWFDTTLIEGIGFSNAPDQPEAIYGRAFFPLRESVSLEPGDTVQVTLRADFVQEDYTWGWETKVCDSKANVKAHFKQSTFMSAPLSLDKLHKTSENYVPQLKSAGAINLFILRQMDGQTSLGDIAHNLMAEFPDNFPTYQVALSQVADIAKEYS
jgi:protein arginine N-methyltransferase 1